MKNKLKDIFNNVTKFHIIGAVTAILFIVIIVVISNINNNEEKQYGELQTGDNSSLEEDIKSIETTVYYSEGDEDGAYNYIINGNEFVLNNTEMPAYYYSEIGNILNEKLQDAGYTSRQLTFTSGTRSGTEYKATFSISECNDTITVTNNMGRDDYSVVIQAN